MSISIHQLKGELEGVQLPGASLDVGPLESHAVDRAVRAAPLGAGSAHPIWFVIASLRGMGISVDELGEMAHQGQEDILLFGGVEILQESALTVGSNLRVTSEISQVERTTTRDGSALDSVVISNRLTSDGGAVLGTVTCTYLFKRGSGSI